VRRVCPSCAKSRAADARESALLKEHGLKAAKLRHGAGCDACNGTGFKGRVAVVEMFRSDATVEEMILRGDRVSAIAAYLETKGFHSLARNGFALAIKGVTTVAEVERAVQS
jgi:type IV pilus assembly protein PilB